MWVHNIISVICPYYRKYIMYLFAQEYYFTEILLEVFHEAYFEK